jgi:hypothetical protein
VLKKRGEIKDITVMGNLPWLTCRWRHIRSNGWRGNPLPIVEARDRGGEQRAAARDGWPAVRDGRVAAGDRRVAARRGTRERLTGGIPAAGRAGARRLRRPPCLASQKAEQMQGWGRE